MVCKICNKEVNNRGFSSHLKTHKRQFFLEFAKQSEYGDRVLFIYRSIFSPNADVKAQVDEEISSLKAILKQ